MSTDQPSPPARQRHEVLVGLHVTDDAAYTRYRAGMTPLLAARGGGFAVDVHVREQLAPTLHPAINRLFVIHFPDVAAKQAFFADPAYLAVRAEHFEPAVAAVYELAAWDRAD